MGNDPPLGPPSQLLDHLNTVFNDMVPAVSNALKCRQRVNTQRFAKLRLAFGACSNEDKAAAQAVARALESKQKLTNQLDGKTPATFSARFNALFQP